MNSKRQTETALVPLVQVPEYAVPLTELGEDEKLHAQKEKERQRHLARARGETSKRTIEEQAAALRRGGRVDPIPPGFAIEALDKELALLRQSIGKRTRELDAISGGLSDTESRKRVPAFNAFMRDALAGIEQLARAYAGAAALADELRRAGYKPSSLHLPDLMPDEVRSLGDPAVQGTPAWRFARALKQGGHLD
jgi:hypothetical protein